MTLLLLGAVAALVLALLGLGGAAGSAHPWGTGRAGRALDAAGVTPGLVAALLLLLAAAVYAFARYGG